MKCCCGCLSLSFKISVLKEEGVLVRCQVTGLLCNDVSLDSKEFMYPWGYLSQSNITTAREFDGDSRILAPLGLCCQAI